ncbi:hypothetical protein VKT23_006740 [Stygiomarasmius scandens]|uniref:Protein-S-isoprenylcysteine O-methyltransferase n=1 Tax=Marasmiellus scandens TaxID=2682957 RepID=A0ABR1JKP1_9AGAR
MEIVKIPLLFSAAIGTHVTTTSPAKSISESEQIATEHLCYTDWLMKQILQGGPALFKNVSWLTVFAEVISILAVRFPGAFASVTATGVPVSSLMSLFVEDKGSLGPALNTVQVAGCLLSVCGGLLRYWCYRALGDLFTFQLTVREKHHLVTTGPYSIVRHPGYLGSSITAVGDLLRVFSRGSWVRESGILQTTTGRMAFVPWALTWVSITLLAASRAKTEDEMMKKNFEQEWIRWSSRVKYKFIPGLF